MSLHNFFLNFMFKILKVEISAGVVVTNVPIGLSVYALHFITLSNKIT